MANINTDLFDLIKALTPEEKKLVVRHGFTYKKEGTHTLKKLFLLLSGQEKYDERELKKEIKNLPNRKKELWQKIMLVLQANENKIEMVKARRKLDFIHILSSKGLHEQILRQLNELKQWSVRYNQPYYMGLTLQYESALAQYLYKENFAEQLPRIREEILDNSMKTTLAIQVYEFYLRVAEADRKIYIQRDETAQKNILPLLKDPLYNLPIKGMSLQSLGTFLDSKSTIHLILREFDKSYHFQNQVREAFASRKDKTPVEWYNYRTWLSNILELHEISGNLDAWDKDIAEFEKVFQQFFTEDLLMETKLRMHQFNYHYHFDRFSSASHLIQETESFYKRNKSKLPEEDIKYHEQNFVLAFFSMGDFDKAWKYCYEWLNNNPKSLMSDVHEFMRMFFLFILLEKNDYTTLGVHLKNFEKSIKGKKGDYTFDRLVINLMKKMSTEQLNRKNRVAHLKWFAEECLQLKQRKHLHTIEVFRLYDFEKWATEKCELLPY